MAPSKDDLPDTQHISATSVRDRNAGEYQADIQFDENIIVTVSYTVGEPVNIVVMSPDQNEIVAKHEIESSEENASLRVREERTLTIVTENAAVLFPKTTLVRAVWYPGDNLTVTVEDPHSEDKLGIYEFDEPVDPKNRGVNRVCNECGEVQPHQQEDDAICINCGSADLRGSDSNWRD